MNSCELALPLTAAQSLTPTRRGLIDRVGPSVSSLKPGDKVVVSFQAACGTCRYCQKRWSSMCDRTNNSSLMANMYGQRDAGFFGYGHMSSCEV